VIVRFGLQEGKRSGAAEFNRKGGRQDTKNAKGFLIPVMRGAFHRFSLCVFAVKNL
jgi:hypothetical protein